MGLNGTVVSAPHMPHSTLVSGRVPLLRFALQGLPALWIIHQLPGLKEKLFTRREHKLSPAIHTSQISINKTHEPSLG